jgi:acyl carrier protein
VDALVEMLKTRIVECLNLDPSARDKMDPEAPLFGTGLGLDSIDALELVVMLEKHFGVRITNIDVGKRAFGSLNAMAAFIRENGGSGWESR